jgi:hypothetical protein
LDERTLNGRYNPSVAVTMLFGVSRTAYFGAGKIFSFDLIIKYY